MTFDVVWTKTAEDELASLWNDPFLRPFVGPLSRSLDERLERNANEVGESRAQDCRIAFEPPLGIFFWVNEKAKRVLVLHVWAFRRR